MSNVPRVVSALEQRFGTLEPIGGGYSSRVYGAGDRVLKVYHVANGAHRVEAERMRAAGLGDWVVDTLEIAPESLPDQPQPRGADVLVMRRFEGAPLAASDIPKALPALGAFLRQLHARHGDPVDLTALHAKLERFRAALEPLNLNLEPLLQTVEQALESGMLAVTSSLCHLDLWHQNVLFAPPDQVLVVDWHKSGFDDPARDYALFFTGTLELLPLEQARACILALTDAEGVTERLYPYIALSTLHDLYWFHTKQPERFEDACALKLPRVRALLETNF
jgi:aminoglycoside phosphotransferase (APT) family kinase protein